MPEEEQPADDARARRRASIAEALHAVRTGPRIPITEDVWVPLRLLGDIQDARQA